MQWQRRNFFWLVLAVLFTGQSLLPVTALAELSVRCVSAPAMSAPCVQMVVPLTDKKTIALRLSRMACCRSMFACRTMPSGCDPKSPSVLRHAAQNSVTQNPVTVLSAPKCVVTVRPITSAAVAPTLHRWMLRSAPALAPPAAFSTVIVLHSALVSTVPHVPFSLSPRLLSASHGLRAPPAA